MAEQDRVRAPQRDPRIDLVKVLASFGVVLVHTSMFVLGERARLGDLDWWLANLANSMGRNTSHLFVMAAGAILLARPLEKRPLLFVATRWRRLIPALVFWTIFYLCWRAWRGERLTAGQVWLDIMKGQPYYHLWFLYAFAGLYLLFPANRLLVRSAAPREVAYLTLGCGILYAWVFTTLMVYDGHVPSSILLLTPLLLPYLLGGYLIYHSALKVPRTALTAVAAGAVMGITLLMAWMYPASAPRSGALMQAIRAPLAFLWTFALFALLAQAPISQPIDRVIKVVAPVTLGIYAIHPFWIDVLMTAGLDLTKPGWTWLLAIPVVYALSTASALALSRIPFIRRVAR